MKDFLLPIAEFLSWFALPVGLIGMVDDWFIYMEIGRASCRERV